MKVFETKFLTEDLDSINKVIQTGQLGFGTNVIDFETQFKSFSDKLFNIATNSASAAAFMIFAYLKEKYGVCDVYTPSLAFTSPAWAAKHFGHNIIWIDVNDNLLFDCNDYLQKRIYEDRKAVLMPILYGGVSNIDNWKIKGDELIVVDSAHCVTPTINYDFAFFSFHPYKPICSSDGGMISTNYKEASDYFQSYRNFGRYNVNDTYDINQEGFKFYMNNLNATIALVSIKKYFENLELRQKNFILLKNQYNMLDHDNRSSYYFGTLITEEAGLINKKYNLARHYPMLHKTSYFNSNVVLNNTEKLHSKIVNLPLWTHL
jgi:dTDP-4-amino-4,6-dideoxygalactose transaminase